LAATGQVTKAWSFDSEFQVDPNQSKTQRYNVAARYRPEPGKLLNFGYRFQRDTLRQLIFQRNGHCPIIGIRWPGGIILFRTAGFWIQSPGLSI